MRYASIYYAAHSPVLVGVGVGYLSGFNVHARGDDKIISGGEKVRLHFLVLPQN